MSRGPKTAAATFIDRVKESLALERDEDLAVRLQVGKSTIATWRRRGQIPFDRRAEMEAISGAYYERAFADHFKEVPAIDRIVRIAYIKALAQLFSSAEKGQLNDLSFHIAEREPELIKSITDRVLAAIEGELTPNEVVTLVQRAYGGAFGDAEEMLSTLRKVGREVPQ